MAKPISHTHEAKLTPDELLAHLSDGHRVSHANAGFTVAQLRDWHDRQHRDAAIITLPPIVLEFVIDGLETMTERTPE